MNERHLIASIIYAALLTSSSNTNNNAEYLAEQSIRYSDYLLKKLNSK